MEVILRDHVDHVGKRGDLVKVADGYARNYLLPRNLALPATEANKNRIARERKISERWGVETPAVEMPDRSGDAEILALAMRSLTSEQREVLVLCRFHELPFSEIGGILGCTAGAARVRAHRALVELREAYQKLAAPATRKAN